jgi:hypothetical protein
VRGAKEYNFMGKGRAIWYGEVECGGLRDSSGFLGRGVTGSTKIG